LRPKGKPDPALYQVRLESLSLLEQQSRLGHIDLLYGDEVKFAEEGYVPYGWQFPEEEVAIEVKRGKSINCLGFLGRNNEFVYKVTEQSINTQFVIGTLDELSLSIHKPTVIVLDNARIHTAKKLKALLPLWQARGLFIFYLPPYSPHLNIVERLWKEIKQGWIKPQDYLNTDTFFYAINRICANIGKSIFIQFSEYKF